MFYFYACSLKSVQHGRRIPDAALEVGGGYASSTHGKRNSADAHYLASYLESFDTILLNMGNSSDVNIHSRFDGVAPMHNNADKWLCPHVRQLLQGSLVWGAARALLDGVSYCQKFRDWGSATTPPASPARAAAAAEPCIAHLITAQLLVLASASAPPVAGRRVGLRLYLLI
jgi:hypothetical protein